MSSNGPSGRIIRHKAAVLALVMVMLPMFSMISGAQQGTFVVEKFTDKALDLNGNGKYDVMEVHGVVDVDIDARYTIRGSLMIPGNGDVPPVVTEQRFEFVSGLSEFNLRFPANFFWNLKYTGNYLVRLQLFDSTENFITSDEYLTASYDYRKFDQPGPMIDLIQETANDVAVDLDGDLKYDFVEISVVAHSQMKGTVMMFAEVLGTKVCNKFEVEPGKVQLQFIIDGKVLIENKVNGSMEAQIGMVCARDPKVLMKYITNPYDHEDFEVAGPIANFDGDLKLHPIDTNGNGKYESLRITATVNISYSMTYTLIGNLHNSDMARPIHVSQTKLYKTGRFDVRMDIPGPEINMTGADGPYQVLISLLGMTFEEPLDTLKSRTGDLKASDFEGPQSGLIFNKEWSDQGVDTNGNDLFDFLEIIIGLEVRVPGDYQVNAHLGLRGFWFSDVFFTQELTQEKNSITIRFKGQDIYEHATDGQFNVDVKIKDNDRSFDDAKSDQPLHISQWTKEYRYKAFEHKEQTDVTPGPVIIDGDDERRTETPIMTITLQKTRPLVSFTYTAENAKAVEFNLVYERFMLFDDADGDGLYDVGEETYEARLSSDEWDMGSIRRDALEGGGGKASFTMSTILDLSPISKTGTKEFIKEWARVSFTFTVSSETENFVSPIDFTLDGDSELKIDISIGFMQNIDGDGLVLEHQLYDRDHLYKFRTHESDGEHLWNGNGQANGEVFGQVPDKEQMISFVSGANKEHAFYSWLPSVEVKTSEGTSSYEDIKATFSTEDQGMRLFMQYPYSKDVSSILHDPSVGLDTENIPIVMVELTTDLNPTTFIFAIVVAGVVVIITWRRGSEDEV